MGFVWPKTYVTSIEVFRWGGPMRFLYKYLELESWETHFVMWTTTNKMTQVQGKPSGIRIVWGNRDWNTSKQRKIMVEEGPRAGKSRKNATWRERSNRGNLLFSSLPFLTCMCSQATPLFLPLTHTNAEFTIPLWSLQGQAGICQGVRQGGPRRHISLSILS